MARTLARLAALVALVLLPVLALPLAASAQLYEWVDEQGRRHFTDDPNRIPEQYRQQTPERLPPRPPAAGGRATPGELQELARVLAAQAGAVDVMKNQMTYVVAATVRVELENQLRRPLSQGEVQQLVATVGRLLWRELLPAAAFERIQVELLDRHLTAAEIRELVRFYRSPTGAKLARLMSVLASEGAERGRELATAQMPEFQRRLAAELRRQFPDLR